MNGSVGVYILVNFSLIETQNYIHYVRKTLTAIKNQTANLWMCLFIFKSDFTANKKISLEGDVNYEFSWKNVERSDKKE